jgi:hypothetical protein
VDSCGSSKTVRRLWIVFFCFSRKLLRSANANSFSLLLKRIPPKRSPHNIANTVIDWFVRIRQNIKERLPKGNEGAQEVPKGNGTARQGTKDRIHAESRYTKLPITDWFVRIRQNLKVRLVPCIHNKK